MHHLQYSDANIIVEEVAGRLVSTFSLSAFYFAKV